MALDPDTQRACVKIAQRLLSTSGLILAIHLLPPVDPRQPEAVCLMLVTGEVPAALFLAGCDEPWGPLLEMALEAVGLDPDAKEFYRSLGTDAGTRARLKNDITVVVVAADWMQDLERISFTIPWPPGAATEQQIKCWWQTAAANYLVYDADAERFEHWRSP